MAFFIGTQTDAELSEGFRRYQEYLHQQKEGMPPSAFTLGTASWYYDYRDHRCPHDAWLEQLIISEPARGERNEKRSTSIRIRLLGAYHDGFSEFYYPEVFSYTLAKQFSASGLGDWIHDEFSLSPEGRLLHEIEWHGTGTAHGEVSRWIIESSDIEFLWIPKT